MKVLLLNGSPRKEGCTYTALTEIAETLKKNGVEAEIFQAGDPSQENVDAAAAIMKEADALIVGSPVYWASPSGQIIESTVVGVVAVDHHAELVLIRETSQETGSLVTPVTVPG